MSGSFLAPRRISIRARTKITSPPPKEKRANNAQDVAGSDIVAHHRLHNMAEVRVWARDVIPERSPSAVRASRRGLPNCDRAKRLARIRCMVWLSVHFGRTTVDRLRKSTNGM